MSFIFLDESGDLGFDFAKKKTSSVFVITFLFVNHKDPIERIVKNFLRVLHVLSVLFIMVVCTVTKKSQKFVTKF